MTYSSLFQCRLFASPQEGTTAALTDVIAVPRSRPAYPSGAGWTDCTTAATIPPSLLAESAVTYCPEAVFAADVDGCALPSRPIRCVTSRESPSVNSLTSRSAGEVHSSDRAEPFKPGVTFVTPPPRADATYTSPPFAPSSLMMP